MLASIASGCSNDTRPSGRSAASSSGPEVFTGSDFYAVPDPLPAGQPGDVIRVQPVDAPTLEHATLWRVMYHSRSIRDADIAVTGLVSIPDAAAPPGGRNIVSWAHGTKGLADKCAPSKNPDRFSIGTFATPFLDDGDLVVATDYEGLGTPGRHPYIVGVSEGRGVIDIVRAVRHMPQAHAGDRYAIWGHSQGGHAALFANQIASSWAPELHLVGTEAGAPATELPLLTTLLRAAPDEALGVMVVAGWSAAYPSADLHLVLTDEALGRLGVVDTGCTDDIVAAFAGLTFDQVFKADITVLPSWRDLPLENDPGHVKVDSPLFIIHGSADEVIPPIASDLLTKRLCGLGQVVSRKVYDGGTHSSVVPMAFTDIKQWIDDRFAGRPAPSTC